MAQTNPRVAISYSWDSKAHQEWIIGLAERLVSDGVDTILDKWNLKEGQDLNQFMESMVSDKSIDRVLIILTKKYAEKANDRIGGVGKETLIISSEVYEKASQTKFIPVVRERDENNNEYVPIYLKGRVYINLENEDTYEAEYEKLLRNIYKRPEYTKPKLGKAPEYLFIEKDNLSNINKLERTVLKSDQQKRKEYKSKCKGYFDAVQAEIISKKTKYDGGDIKAYGKLMLESIDSLIEIRNSVIRLFEDAYSGEYTLDIDVVTEFLSNLLNISNDYGISRSNYEIDNDNVKFFLKEVFLYYVAILIKHEQYELLGEYLNSPILISSDRYEGIKAKNICIYSSDILSIKEYYNETYSQNYITPATDYLLKRIPEGFTRMKIIEADMLCHYSTAMQDLIWSDVWFPTSYIYKRDLTMELLQRLISKRYFEKIKALFCVNTPKELADKIRSIKIDYSRFRFSQAFDSIPPMASFIDPDKIASI